MSKTATCVTTVKQLEKQIQETDGVTVFIRAGVRTRFISKKCYPKDRALNSTHTVKHLHERIRSVIGDDIEFVIINGLGQEVRRTTGHMGKLRKTYQL
jgi:hypothetical protein